MATILIPIPSRDFDPTEAAVPWQALRAAGHAVVFATPDGLAGQADPRMLSGRGLGPWAALLRADARGRDAYAAMAQSAEFQQPRRWDQVHADEFAALLLPGGHAAGMKPYLESPLLQALVADFFGQAKVVAAICHGVLLAARSQTPLGQSVLFGRQTTALLQVQEMTAWALTCAWLGDYYRTYPESVQAEVTRLLKAPADFRPGPLALLRDDPQHLQRGFVVRDGNYLSARWPGDAHRFAAELLVMLAEGAAD